MNDVPNRWEALDIEKIKQHQIDDLIILTWWLLVTQIGIQFNSDKLKKKKWIFN